MKYTVSALTSEVLDLMTEFSLFTDKLRKASEKFSGQDPTEQFFESKFGEAISQMTDSLEKFLLDNIAGNMGTVTEGETKEI